MKYPHFRTLILLCLGTVFFLLTGCQAGTPAEETGSETVPATTRTDPPATAPSSGEITETIPETDTEKSYADIGNGTFSLEQDIYYSVVGKTIHIKGTFDFDEKDTVPLTVTSDDPDAIEAHPDGTVTIRKAGDFTLTVREEKYGTSDTCRLTTVGDLADNIIVSVPVWRKKWINPEQFGYMKDAEVDMTVVVSGRESRNYAMSEAMLDEAQKTWSGGTGLRVLVHSTHDMMEHILTMSDRQMSRMVARFRGKPAFAGYHLIDEPFECSPYAYAQNRLGVLDPDALTDINFLPGGAYRSFQDYENRMDDYCRLLDEHAYTYLSFDNYPFGPEPDSVSEYQLFGNLEAAWRAGLRNHVPTAFYLQAVGGFGNSYRRPDRAQLTYHASSALAYGFKWIKYWSWFVPDYGENPEETTYKDYTDAIIGKDGKPTDLYEVAKDLHHRVHTIGPILVRCEAEEVYHTGKRSTEKVYTRVPDTFFVQPDSPKTYAIVSLFRHQETGRQYLMIVNKDIIHPSTMAFTLKGVDRLTEINTRTGEGKILALADHALSVTLEAGDFAFFELPEGDFRTNAGISSEHPNLVHEAAHIRANLSVGKDGYFIGCAVDGRRTSEDSENRAWATPAGETGSMILSFDRTVRFNRIDLYPSGRGISVGSKFPQVVKIHTARASAPDEWTEVYANEAFEHPTDRVPVIRLDDTEADFIRITISASLTNAEIAEIEIYADDGSVPLPPKTSYEEAHDEKGVNYALGKTPFASGSAYESSADGWGLDNLTDGSKLQSGGGKNTNGWMSQGISSRISEGNAVFGGVDLGASFLLNQVDLYPRKSGEYFPSAYEIQISEDGTHYTRIYETDHDPETAGVVRSIRLDQAVKARYVRVVGHKLTGPIEPTLGGYIMQLSEIEVFWN